MGQMEMKCILYFYMCQSYSGEQCGPKASCLVNFADIKMKLVVIVYNNELQIKFEFRHCPWTW
jgi:hypothetical protein